MLRSPGIRVISLILSVLAVSFVAFQTGCRDQEARSPQQQARIEQLNELSETEFSSGRDAVSEVVEQMPVTDLFGLATSLAIDKEKLSPAVEASLRKTITDFMMCYGADSAESLLEFMALCDESLSKEGADLLRLELSNIEGNEEASTQSLGSDLLVTAWKQMECASDWESVLCGEGKIALWRCPSQKVFNEVEPHTRDKSVFWNETTYRHLFSGRRSMDDERKLRRSIVVADVQFGIGHTRKRKNERGLYFIRFWWDSKGKQWHPQMFRFVATDPSQLTVPPKLLF